VIRLVRVELRRLFARRLTLFAALGLLVIAGLVVFGTAHDAKPLSGQDLTMAQQSFQDAQKDWKLHGAEMIKECRKAEAAEQKNDPTVDFGCDMQKPTWENWGKPAVQLKQALPDTLQIASYALAFVAFLLGAGFLAAEFSTGSMGNWLTFEPRRSRVYGSKLLAAGLGVVVPAVVVVALLTGSVWIICHAWGSTALPKGWGPMLLMGLRVVALTVAAAVAGAALGTLVRHTAAAIGLAMAYVVLVEGMFANSFLRGWQPWLLVKNTEAWVAKGTAYFLDDCHVDQAGNYMCTMVERHVSFGHGALYLAVACAAIVLLGALVFRRRDVA
jgi:ABC-2 type transport system permease protein